MTKIDIFSGFLGAGKTTLIKKLIKEAFAGLQLVLMATVLLMGNYTGYKLSELKRFKPLVDEMKSGATPGKDK
jgi:Ni2+-binding GTPase involved in maturation of urease and hydrogenase